jgi:hypothetical protein
MKLVITTQYLENYAPTGSVPYWKAKGGEVYVVRNLTWDQVDRIEANGTPTLTSLIEYSNEGSREYILNTAIVENDGYECESWESVIELSYDRVERCWVASRTTHRDECWADGIDYKVECWIPRPGGEREDYTCAYYGAAA